MLVATLPVGVAVRVVPIAAFSQTLVTVVGLIPGAEGATGKFKVNVGMLTPEILLQLFSADTVRLPAVLPIVRETVVEGVCKGLLGALPKAVRVLPAGPVQLYSVAPAIAEIE